MIQFNLLPDVKVDFIKTRRRKRMIVFVSAIVSAVTFAAFILLLLFVRVNQPKHMKALDEDIKSNVSTLQAVPDLDKILTIQNQLNSLPGLHDKKVVSSRVVDYLNKMTPSQATISDVTIDFEANTMTIKGNSDSLITVNKFVDTIKFTDYKIEVKDKDDDINKAFKDVVLQSFSVSANGQQAGANAITYELSLAFEPKIFATIRDTKNPVEPVSLVVPKIISTRSATETPDSLFAPQPAVPDLQPQGGQR